MLFLDLEILDVAAAGAEPLAVDRAVDAHGLAIAGPVHVHGATDGVRTAELKMLLEKRAAIVLGALFGHLHLVAGVGDDFLLALAVIVMINVQAARDFLRGEAVLGKIGFAS